jgi:putative ABC transport system permease protein
MTMPNARSINRGMFWRIERRLLSANRGRVVVILLALGAGAAVSAALLNLQIDAKRRITSEFRSFGANGIILPRGADSASAGATLSQNVAEIAANSIPNQLSSASADLYLIADVHNGSSESPDPVVVDGRERIYTAETSGAPSIPDSSCDVGIKAAAQLKLKLQDTLSLQAEGAQTATTCRVRSIISTGDASDSQIILPLAEAQLLTALRGRISAVHLDISGKPQEIAASIASLQLRLPGVDVRPIRQFTEGETKIYNRISGILNATVAVILILTALCVMAAMTSIAMERKNDVALMKAIGGAARGVIRLFLVEAALLGLAGGLMGAAFGLLLSIWLGKAVFGVAAEPRLVVYPVSVALAVIVAILGAFPLRRLAEIRPASIFRGEQ